MAGVEKAWSKVASELNENAVDIKTRLNNLVHRRNQIVHEGDMKRASRPRSLQFNEIDPAEIRDDIDWVDCLIDAMDRVVTDHP